MESDDQLDPDEAFSAATLAELREALARPEAGTLIAGEPDPAVAHENPARPEVLPEDMNEYAAEIGLDAGYWATRVLLDTLDRPQAPIEWSDPIGDLVDRTDVVEVSFRYGDALFERGEALTDTFVEEQPDLAEHDDAFSWLAASFDTGICHALAEHDLHHDRTT